MGLEAGNTTTNRTGWIVAIDGPAGAGKSTVVAHLARTFGFLNLETGAMYRALALKALRTGTPVDVADRVLTLTQSTTIALQPSHAGNVVLLDGTIVTGELRTAEVTAAASHVSVHAEVREWMVSAQRAMGLSAACGAVMEGRDIGTVVFPDAPVKIFLDASAEARGGRRFQQQPGSAESRAALVSDMQDRDERDRSRQQSPLKPAPDATLLDTTQLSLEDVLQQTETLVRNQLDR